MINVQSTLRTVPDLRKNVSHAVVLGSDGNSYTICTQTGVCVCIYIYIYIYIYIHTHTYSSQYGDAGRAKEIKRNWDSRECRVPCFRQSYSREILRVLWSPNVDYRVHYSAPVFPVLILMNPVHKLTLCFCKIYLDIFSLCA